MRFNSHIFHLNFCAMKVNHFKRCFVPLCSNNTRDTPVKIFLCVPRKEEVRRQWLAAVNNRIYSNCPLFCCEDHFDLQEDATNWMFFITFGTKITLKDDILPRYYINWPNINKDASQLRPKIRKRKFDKMNVELPSKKLRNSNLNLTINSSGGNKERSEKNKGIMPLPLLPPLLDVSTPISTKEVSTQTTNYNPVKRDFASQCHNFTEDKSVSTNFDFKFFSHCLN